jgi:hypothetical protein
MSNNGSSKVFKDTILKSQLHLITERGVDEERDVALDRLQLAVSLCETCNDVKTQRYKGTTKNIEASNVCGFTAPLIAAIMHVFIKKNITNKASFDSVMSSDSLSFHEFTALVTETIGHLWDLHDDRGYGIEKIYRKNPARFLPDVHKIHVNQGYIVSFPLLYNGITLHHAYIWFQDNTCFIVDSWFDNNTRTSRPVSIREFPSEKVFHGLNILDKSDGSLPTLKFIQRFMSKYFGSSRNFVINKEDPYWSPCNITVLLFKAEELEVIMNDVDKQFTTNGTESAFGKKHKTKNKKQKTKKQKTKNKKQKTKKQKFLNKKV